MSEAKTLPPLEAAGGEVSLRHDNLCLGAEDLLGKGRIRLTIEAVGFMQLTLGGGKGRYPVMRFRGAKKVLVLNKTNLYTLKMRLRYGATGEEWIGKDIFIEADFIRDQKGNPVVKFNRTHGVRIVPEVPPARAKGKGTDG